MFGEILWMLIIPAIALGAMMSIYRHKVTWKEATLQFLVPVLICLGTAGIFYFCSSSDTEYLNSYAQTAHYEEPWNERVSCSHPRYVTESYTDSNGKSQTRSVQDGYQHSYDVDDHGPRYYVKDNCGSHKGISKTLFKELSTRWDNRKFKDMHRSYHTRDGDMYFTTFDGNFDKMETFTWTKTYKNKVQNSDSVFTELEVEEDDVEFYGLHDYNTSYQYSYEPIYGWADAAASKKLTKFNAINGKRKQLHMNLLVFHDKTMEAALYQQAYWKGGNKNEFNVCIGLSGQTIKWCKVITWCEVDILKIETEQDIGDMEKFDAEVVVEYLGENVPKKWIRKEFEDFEYISVEIPFAGKITCFILITLSTIGMCIVTHKMDIN
ncbi:hypothetical protein DRO61_08745 [Candidatus Bathyarchaeota archaeon]|nr:MAG: hypothetical protein DRO61_08745 [Candidatus Bathyarchaeota archaeon]